MLTEPLISLYPAKSRDCEGATIKLHRHLSRYHPGKIQRIARVLLHVVAGRRRHGMSAVFRLCKLMYSVAVYVDVAASLGMLSLMRKGYLTGQREQEGNGLSSVQEKPGSGPKTVQGDAGLVLPIRCVFPLFF